ncbi:MAG: DUF2933 domain-containing protein [Dehalococcoidia bacterium]
MKMCFNWKVIGGLAVVGVGVAVFAPNLIGVALPLLLLAACPLSMILMMRGMGGMGGKESSCATNSKQASEPAVTARSEGASLAELKSQLAGIQAQQETITREIAHLESAQTPAVREAEAVAFAAEERARDPR